MIPSGLRLVLAPGLLLAMAGLAWALPPRWKAPVRILGVLSLGAAIGLLIGDAGVVASVGSVEGSFGRPLAGVDFLFRADSTGLFLALVASGAALLALLDTDRGTGETAAMLLCAAGTVGAALAGNVVMLFAGLEASNLGTTLLITGGRRVGRGAAAALVIEHTAALGLLTAAVELSITVGTNNLSALPDGAVTLIVAIPWALAGAIRILAPAFAPAQRGLAWAAVAAIPSGAAVLLRLRGAADGPLADPVTFLLAGLGAAAALAGAVMAARVYCSPTRCGRALVVAAAGPAIALVGFSSNAAAIAAAASLCALELCAAVAPLWTKGAEGSRTRWLAASALLIAGGLPLGFGTTSLTLALGAVASLGRVAAALILSLGGAAVLAATAAVRATLHVLAARREDSTGRPAPLAVVAVVASAGAALLPGGVAAVVLPTLVPSAIGYNADLATVRGPQGGWAGGYVLVAALWLAIVVFAAFRVVGVQLAPLEHREGAVAPRSWRLVLRQRRIIRRPLTAVLRAASSLDRWLVAQPQLPLVLVAALLAILFLH